MQNIRQLHDERLLLSIKPTLTLDDKTRLRELNELLKNVKWSNYYCYKRWLVGDYLMGDPRFIAGNEGRMLRANSQSEIERLIDNE